MRTDNEQERMQVLRRLIQWCNTAPGFTRARHHCEPDNLPNAADVLPDAVLLAHRLDDPPAGLVLTDEELDAIEPRDALLPPAPPASDSD